MSWLAGGLTQSVTGKITQLSGQLKDILTEGTEDVVDPTTELKVIADKLKENEKHVEFLKIELTRWQDESNELNLKCQTYEAQLEQRSNDYRTELLAKDSQINDLKNEINSLREFKSETFESGNYQKSSLMEEFEDIMPSSELNDFIHLQKEIKRLSEDNSHLLKENKTLNKKLKKYETGASSKSQDNLIDANNLLNDQRIEYENTIELLRQEIMTLKNRLKTDKDKHQEEIIAIQNNYTEKMNVQLKEKQNIVEAVQLQLNDLQIKFDQNQKQYEASRAPSASKISSNKSDDGWCINDEIQFDTCDEKIEIKNLKALLGEKDIEINKLQNQIDMFENDLEQANSLILRLKNVNKSKSSPDVGSQSGSTNHEEIEALKQQIRQLTIKNEDLSKQIVDLNNSMSLEKEKTEILLSEKQIELDNQYKSIDNLSLQLKQHQQAMQQEKLIQIQEQKQDRQEMAKIKIENTELKIKLDEKISEIKLLGDQISDLNNNINSLKSADSNLFSEFKQKTEEFLNQLNTANQEILSLKTDNEKLIEQKKQFEFVLDEKTRELSQLKQDLQKHLQHIAAQSKAIDKLQSELKAAELANQNKLENSSKTTEGVQRQNSHVEEELQLVKQQYNQIYTYLEQKNQESLSYYNEIQRLNGILSELNRELSSAKAYNENLNEQYENLVKECQMEQKLVEDLNQQMSELNKTLLNTGNHSSSDEATDNKEAVASVTTKEFQSIEVQTDFEVEETKKENDVLVKQEAIDTADDKINRNPQYEFNIDSEQVQRAIRVKLDETISYYENILNVQNENFKQTLLNEEQQQMRLSKEVEDLRMSITEITNNYNRELFEAEEREKQLTRSLDETESMFKNQNSELENARIELESFKRDNSKLEELQAYYENMLKSHTESFNQSINNEQQQHLRLSKELERLREHLVEMSDSYNKEAIQAEEREKQLRTSLNEAEQKLQAQGANLENSSKEIEFKIENLNQINIDLKNENSKLKDKLKQTEETLNHQVKVTKNLELVLERLQNDKDDQQKIELSQYQQTIKDQVQTIHSLQKDAQNYQSQIENLERLLNSANIIEEQLERKEEALKQFQAQIATKDALIESLDKRVNEIQKINDSYIEKEIIKNLIIGYIKVNQTNEKKQVLKLISTMLNFSMTELEQAENSMESKWFSNLLKPTSTPVKGGHLQNVAGEPLNKSFTELLIQYVDRESKPKPNLAFDLANTDASQTNKKTDIPNILLNDARNPSNSSSSASAIHFFNSSLVNPTNNNEVTLLDIKNKDLTLINRTQSSNNLASSSASSKNSSNISNLPSSQLANSFLEQILKS